MSDYAVIPIVDLTPKVVYDETTKQLHWSPPQHLGTVKLRGPAPQIVVPTGYRARQEEP